MIFTWNFLFPFFYMTLFFAQFKCHNILNVNSLRAKIQFNFELKLIRNFEQKIHTKNWLANHRDLLDDTSNGSLVLWAGKRENYNRWLIYASNDKAYTIYHILWIKEQIELFFEMFYICEAKKRMARTTNIIKRCKILNYERKSETRRKKNSK